MRILTLTEWKNIPDDYKMVVTPGAIVYRGESEEYIGRHAMMQGGLNGCELLIEGVHFAIKPTFDELNDVRIALLESIDREKVRGFHPWHFIGSYEVDDQTLIVAETRQGAALDVSIRVFEKTAPRWRNEIKRYQRVASSQKDISLRVKRLFAIMGKAPKQVIRAY